MFSGIVQGVGRVVAASTRSGSRVVRIQKLPRTRLKVGASIAVNGVCSTVRALTTTYFEVEYIPTTLEKTTAGALTKGDSVNLEPSLRLNDFVDGHLVQGHVDARGIVSNVRVRGASHEITIRAPKSLMPFIALHGSVALNGVSLTVAARARGTFTVALVSHTCTHTNLGRLTKGVAVNIETDLFARYLAQRYKK